MAVSDEPCTAIRSLPVSETFWVKIERLQTHGTYCAQCTGHNVLRTMYWAQCTAHNVLGTMYWAQCTAHNVLGTMYCAQCTAHNPTVNENSG